MREIKFRAWDPEEKEMICGGFQFWFDGHGHIKDMPPLNWPCIEVMQYTGLKANGQEIYEGDVVKHNQGIDEVRWCEDSWCVGKWTPGNLSNFADNCEIIGNIYENPDLLGD